jgi:hypothetical protein
MPDACEFCEEGCVMCDDSATRGEVRECLDAAQKAYDRLRVEAHADYKKLLRVGRERDEARAEVERLREVVRAMVLWSRDGTPRYRTANNIGQDMPEHIERVVRENVPTDCDGVAVRMAPAATGEQRPKPYTTDPDRDAQDAYGTPEAHGEQS